jgi:hypothetical protein
VSTESNNDVGTYQFSIDYHLPEPSNTALKVQNARQFQIKILPRPVFAPFFETPLDQTLKVVLNDALSYKLPTYTRYDRDDEGKDTIVIRVTDP